MKTFFIGHFSSRANSKNVASSSAGNQVQRQITEELSQNISGKIFSFSMEPASAWPKGKLVYKSSSEGEITFIGYLNLPIIKHVLFSIRVLYKAILIKPELCVQYNSYVFENIALIIFKILHSSTFLVIFIQDVNVCKCYFKSLKKCISSFSEKISISFVRYFDLIIPISHEIISDFNLPLKNCFVFQGGITKYAELFINQIYEKDLEEIAVFAGSLEAHNGVDRLVNSWISLDIKNILHIFGRGSLQDYIIEAANKSKFIIFHGHRSEEQILEWQQRSRWNICLRYSEGLNQKYFFPSKFFNLAYAPGAVIVNDFHALPLALRQYVQVVSDDLSDLQNALTCGIDLSSAKILSQRRVILKSNYNWNACIVEIVSRFDSQKAM